MFHSCSCSVCTPLGHDIRVAYSCTTDMIYCIAIKVFSLFQHLRAAQQVHQYDHDVDEVKGWMQEKEAVVDIDDYGYDLPGVQTLLSQLEGVEVRGSVMKQ